MTLWVLGAQAITYQQIDKCVKFAKLLEFKLQEKFLLFPSIVELFSNIRSNLELVVNEIMNLNEVPVDSPALPSTVFEGEVKSSVEESAEKHQRDLFSIIGF